MSDDIISEFIELDPTELHLVGAAANDFKPLLAKAQALTQKGRSYMFNRSEQMLKAALEPVEKRIKKAKKSGDTDALKEALESRALCKMVVLENWRAEHPGEVRSRFGPGAVQLFKNTGRLPEDVHVHGI